MGVEINKYSDIRPVLATEAIPEGRMVLITTHSETVDFGSWADLVGIKLPDNATEAAVAYYVAAFAVDNRQIPIFEPYPALGQGTQRRGWSADENVPFTAAVHLTPPGNKKFGTIPANTPALAFGQGEFTVYSGGFVLNASLAPGAYVEALNTADDGAAEAGKLNYRADATGAIGTVISYDSAAKELVFRTFNP
jgi:hypothetical protein